MNNAYILKRLKALENQVMAWTTLTPNGADHASHAADHQRLKDRIARLEHLVDIERAPV